MTRARCVKFVRGRGFGFVAPIEGGGRDIYVHYSAVADRDDLEVGELVDVEFSTDELGRRTATRCERVAP